MRGGEKVLEVLCELFPDATLLTLLHNRGSVSPTIERMKIHTSFVQHLPLKTTTYRNYLPLFPAAIGSMTFDEYDLVLSSSHCVAKGARARPDALHICYCHTPMRYVWDMYDDYFGKGKTGWPTRTAMRLVRPYLRRWDVRTSGRVDHYIANSNFVAERIRRTYGRTSEVMHPPVETGRFSPSERDDGYFLVVGALVPYKRADLAVRAFSRLSHRLVVVGSGPEEHKLKAAATKNVEFLGWQSDDDVAKLYAGCRAVVFPGVEDFGIVPLEAMASGKPVIAYARGGALETVVADGAEPTGVFFHEQTAEAVLAAVQQFQPERFVPSILRRHAQRFDRAVFKQRITDFIAGKVSERSQRTGHTSSLTTAATD
jgi:glycosyltransferase involved in cell wall biosynthesis